MPIAIPSIQMIRNRLEQLSQTQIKQLATDSEVPFGTLMKIRIGVTTNPGTETVRKFWSLLEGQARGEDGAKAKAV